MDSRPADAPAHGLDSILADIKERHLGKRDGSLASYIPQLAAVDPERFGIAVATVGGRLHTVGDVDCPFTIQSVSKAFVYCLALELIGRDAVLKRVGDEPRGDAFNAIIFVP